MLWRRSAQFPRRPFPGELPVIGMLVSGPEIWPVLALKKNSLDRSIVHNHPGISLMCKASSQRAQSPKKNFVCMQGQIGIQPMYDTDSLFIKQSRIYSYVGILLNVGRPLHVDDLGAFLAVDHHELVAGCMARQTPR
jgi:hypothetical protein